MENALGLKEFLVKLILVLISIGITKQREGVQRGRLVPTTAIDGAYSANRLDQ
jgi:hypothetical protein